MVISSKRSVSAAHLCAGKQLGTCHAVLAARAELCGFNGDILVIFGDQPLYTKHTIETIVNKRREGYAVVCLGFRPEDPARYGRLIMNAKGELERIVEYKDASDEERAVTFCNSGMMCFNGETMFDILAEISNENAAGEYYLTDAVAVALRKGLKCSAVECPVEEASAANTQEELALLEELYKKRKGK